MGGSGQKKEQFFFSETGGIITILDSEPSGIPRADHYKFDELFYTNQEGKAFTIRSHEWDGMWLLISDGVLIIEKSSIRNRCENKEKRL